MRPSRSKDRAMWTRNLEHEVISIWESARKNGKSHTWILEQYQLRVRNSPRFDKLSNEERYGIFTVHLACGEMANRRDLVWRLGPQDGPRAENAAWDDQTSQLARDGKLYGAHFWRGTDCAFSTYACLNDK